MSKKGLLFFSVLVISAILLGACAPQSGEADCSSDDVLCVGLVTDVGEVDDKSFNQSAWEGVRAEEKEMGAQMD